MRLAPMSRCAPASSWRLLARPLRSLHTRSSAPAASAADAVAATTADRLHNMKEDSGSSAGRRSAQRLAIAPTRPWPYAGARPTKTDPISGLPLHPNANPDWQPPPLPEHLWDPVELARRNAKLGSVFRPGFGARHTLLPLESGRGQGASGWLVPKFIPQNPTPTNPLINPQTLTEALRSSPLIYPPWTRYSKRVGIIGQKMGMTPVWDEHGNRIVLSCIRVDRCQVTMINPQLTKAKCVLMQIGHGLRKFKNTHKAEIVHCFRAGVMPKQTYASFPVTTDAVLPLGTEITVRHFVPGQFVDVRGVTRGKGTQGVMWRHGFGGQPASHGVSLTHRSTGSIGSNQWPGRVWAGKRMAGRMGFEYQTLLSRRVYKIDVKRNLIFVKGPIPGIRGGVITLRDAVGKRWNPKKPPPFPTFFPAPGEVVPDELVMPVEGFDPLIEVADLEVK